MGPLDRCLRIIIGIVLILLGTIYVKGVIGTVLIILSIPFILPSIFGVCPLYSLLGISTKNIDCCGGCCR
ncbi:MAG: DUF2892 domain-containing protein [Firmicutes bacterium]|nr:DUF2892 domain-containing protein [Bacillota bacterium]